MDERGVAGEQLRERTPSMTECREGADKRALRFAMSVDHYLVIRVALGKLGAFLLGVHNDENVVSSSLAGIHDVEHQWFACNGGQRLGLFESIASATGKDGHAYGIHGGDRRVVMADQSNDASNRQLS